MSLLRLGLLLACAAAAQPVTATYEEQVKIMEEVRKGIASRERLERAAIEEEYWRLKHKRDGGLDAEDLDKWDRADKDRKMNEADMNMALNKAVKLTEAAYKAGPRHSAGSPRNGPAQGKTATWAPRYFNDDQRYIEIVAKDGSKQPRGRAVPGRPRRHDLS